jgi:hypothetical protein
MIENENDVEQIFKFYAEQIPFLGTSHTLVGHFSHIWDLLKCIFS